MDHLGAIHQHGQAAGIDLVDRVVVTVAIQVGIPTLEPGRVLADEGAGGEVVIARVQEIQADLRIVEVTLAPHPVEVVGRVVQQPRR